MSRYELFLFCHIAAAIVWVGAGVLIQVLATRAERSGDDEGLRRTANDAGELGNVLFVPSSLAVVVFGLLLVIDGPWSFGWLWVTLGLIGYLATFATGILVMKPGAERVAAIMARDGGLSAEGSVAIRSLLAKARIDTVVLFLVVADMVIKPTGDDVGVLIVMALITVVGIGLTVARVRAIESSGPAAQFGATASAPGASR